MYICGKLTINYHAMEELLNIYSNLDIWMQAYWGCAIVSTVFFIIQMALTLIGMDSTDMDVDFDGPDTMDLGGGLSLFSIRNLVNFFCGAGWAGVCLNNAISNRYVLLLISLAIGVAFVYLFFLMKKQTKKLEHNGAFNIADCVGNIATVYLRIPAQRSGQGKVQVSINGSVQEIEAITDDTEPIASNSKVHITAAYDDSTLLVSRHQG